MSIAKRQKVSTPPATVPVPDVSQQLQEVLNQMNGSRSESKVRVEELQKCLENENKKPKIKMIPIKEKKFTLETTFNSLSTINDGNAAKSGVQSFYGTDWNVSLKRREDCMGLYLYCQCPKIRKEWWLKARARFFVYVLSRQNDMKCQKQYTHTFSRVITNHGFHKFMKWEELLKLSVADEIAVRVEVAIIREHGINEPRSFDKKQREFADVVLICEEEHFYVLKKFLASQSGFFDGLFFSKFKDAGKSEYTITEVTAKNFQLFLETVHGHFPINDSNVKDILPLADKYIALGALKACGKFLKTQSDLDFGTKFELAKQFVLEDLLKWCISKMNIEEIESALDDKELTVPVAVKLRKELAQRLKNAKKEASAEKEPSD